MKKLLILIAIMSYLVAVTSCAPAEELQTVNFREVIQNREYYVNHYYHFTEGVVVFISEEEDDFFVVTSLPIPKEVENLEANDFILVNAQYDTLQIGDVVSLVGNVNKETGKNDQGDRMTVYYVSQSSYYPLKVVDAVDAEDPDFERLISFVNDEISNNNLIFTYLLLWFFFINPSSPISPLNNN